MPQNKVVAVTGGIGSGKSTVMNILKTNNKLCVSCDELNSKLLKDANYLIGLERLFPYAFINGKFDKPKLKERIFTDEAERKKLNSYSHCMIKSKLTEELKKISDSDVFVEVPILNQTDFESIFDEIWVVMSDKNLREKRISVRDSVNTDFANKIISTQTDEYVFSKPTKFIFNNGSIVELENQINGLLNT